MLSEMSAILFRLQSKKSFIFVSPLLLHWIWTFEFENISRGLLFTASPLQDSAISGTQIGQSLKYSAWKRLIIKVIFVHCHGTQYIVLMASGHQHQNKTKTLCAEFIHWLYYGDITWALKHLISLPTGLFVQKLIKAYGKETIKVLH